MAQLELNNLLKSTSHKEDKSFTNSLSSESNDQVIATKYTPINSNRDLTNKTLMKNLNK